MLDLSCLQIHHAWYQAENLGKPSELIRHYYLGKVLKQLIIRGGLCLVLFILRIYMALLVGQNYILMDYRGMGQGTWGPFLNYTDLINYDGFPYNAMKTIKDIEWARRFDPSFVKNIIIYLIITFTVSTITAFFVPLQTFICEQVLWVHFHILRLDIGLILVSEGFHNLVVFLLCPILMWSWVRVMNVRLQIGILTMAYATNIWRCIGLKLY